MNFVEILAWANVVAICIRAIYDHLPSEHRGNEA